MWFYCWKCKLDRLHEKCLITRTTSGFTKKSGFTKNVWFHEKCLISRKTSDFMIFIVLGGPETGSTLQTVVWKFRCLSKIRGWKSIGYFSEFWWQVIDFTEFHEKCLISRFFSLLFQFDEMSNVTRQTEFTILPITGYHNFDEINFKNSPSFVSTATNWHPWVISRNFCLFHDFPIFWFIFYRQLCLELFIQPTKIGPICHTGTGHTFCQNYKFGVVWFQRWRFCL